MFLKPIRIVCKGIVFSLLCVLLAGGICTLYASELYVVTQANADSPATSKPAKQSTKQKNNSNPSLNSSSNQGSDRDSNKVQTKPAPPSSRPTGDTSAYDSWIASARKGDPVAQYNIALIFEQGTGIKADLKQAVFWYQKAAAGGHKNAQYNLGTLYHFGKAVTKSETIAADWYEKAARQGHVAAQSSLAYIHSISRNRLLRSAKKAAYWYSRAAKLGYPEAQYNLGLMYSTGRGVILDFKKAYAWFDLAHANQYKNALKSRQSAASRLTAKQLKEAQQLSQTWRQLYFRKYP